MATKEPLVYVVRDTFATDVDGVPVVYGRGEPVDPADPLLRTRPHLFEPLRFPHPVRAEAPVEQATAAPGEKRGA